MDVSKSLESNSDELKCMVIEIVDFGKDLLDENQAIILLNYVLAIFCEVKNAFQFRRYEFKFEIMESYLRVRDVEIK